MFIRALEDIAEKEQERLFQQEKELVEKAECLNETKHSDSDKPASPGSSPSKKSPSPDFKVGADEKEVPNFKKGGKGARSPHHPAGKFA